MCQPKNRQLAELKDVHKGQLGFVLGNGWSIRYYDVDKMKGDGILIGCNLSFQLYPLDYLVWQDQNVHDKCAKFDGIKVVPQKRRGAKDCHPDTTYFYGFGKLEKNKHSQNSMRLMHSGGLALQLAIKLGCNPVVLAGCDCRIFDVPSPDINYHGHRSNIFKDKQAARINKRGFIKETNGKKTSNHLQSFMKKFELVYEAYKDSVDIYMLGPWSISEIIPWVEWGEYWSDEHPERKKDGASKERDKGITLDRGGNRRVRAGERVPVPTGQGRLPASGG